MKNQVLSIEQMQELKKLGIDTSKASMFWHPAFYRNNGILDYDRYEDIPRIKLENNYNLEYDIPTFTLQDILKYLEKIKPSLTKDDGSIWFMEVHNLERDSLMYCEGCESESPLETAFKTIKWCKENGFV